MDWLKEFSKKKYYTKYWLCEKKNMAKNQKYSIPT